MSIKCCLQSIINYDLFVLLKLYLAASLPQLLLQCCRQSLALSPNSKAPLFANEKIREVASCSASLRKIQTVLLPSSQKMLMQTFKKQLCLHVDAALLHWLTIIMLSSNSPSIWFSEDQSQLTTRRAAHIMCWWLWRKAM